MKKCLLLIVIFFIVSCKTSMIVKKKTEKAVVINFIHEVYIDGNQYNPKIISKYISPSDSIILENLSDKKKEYLKFIVESYQLAYKKQKINHVDILKYNEVQSEQFGNIKFLYDDYSKVYCVIKNNKVSGYFIVEKENNKTYLKSFARLIPYQGNIQPLILNELKNYKG